MGTDALASRVVKRFEASGSTVDRVAKRYGAGDQATRHEGLCGFCGKRQRVQNEKLVLHGYKRPGHGSTEGRCPGAGLSPMEISPETAQRAIEWLSEQIQDAKKQLQLLDRDPDNAIVAVYEGRQEVHKPLKLVDLSRFTGWSTPEDYRKELIRRAGGFWKARIVEYTVPLKERQEWVRDWKAQPLITFDESVRRKQELKQDREQQKLQIKDAKYQAAKDKLLGRIKPAFLKFKQDEAKYKRLAEGPTLSNPKVLQAAGALMDRQRSLTSMLTDSVVKLSELKDWNRQFVKDDLGIDEIYEHLGITLSGRNFDAPKTTYGDFYGIGATWSPNWPGFAR